MQLENNNRMSHLPSKNNNRMSHLPSKLSATYLDILCRKRQKWTIVIIRQDSQNIFHRYSFPQSPICSNISLTRLFAITRSISASSSCVKSNSNVRSVEGICDVTPSLEPRLDAHERAINSSRQGSCLPTITTPVSGLSNTHLAATFDTSTPRLFAISSNTVKSP